MKLKELTFPVRAYWDLTPAPTGRPVDYLKICEELVGMKILYLELTDTGFPLSEACIRILERLLDENIALSFTASGKCPAPSLIDLLSRFNIRTLLIEATSLNGLASAAETIGECRKILISTKSRLNQQYSPGISFLVNRDNFRDLPEAVSICREKGISSFVLPMQRLLQTTDCFFTDAHERQKLSERINPEDLQDIKLTIHDPFLWKVFYPAVEFPEGGCQAANSMVHISSEGEVYPCPSLPIKLGSLSKGTLKEMMASSQKKKLRALLTDLPEGCYDCVEAKKCAGGCRGRSYILAGSLGLPDPSCR